MTIRILISIYIFLTICWCRWNSHDARHPVTAFIAWMGALVAGCSIWWAVLSLGFWRMGW